MNRALLHPDTKVPILTWWQGIYDHVFVALHPFCQLPDARLPEGLRDSPGFDLGDWLAKTLESDMDDVAKQTGRPLAWAEVHRRAAPDHDRREFDLAAWLLAVLGPNDRTDRALQQRIRSFCCRNGVMLPAEGGLSPVLEPAIAEFLGQFGATSVLASDEHRSTVTDLSVSALARPEPAARIPSGTGRAAPWALHLEEPGVLLSWSFEDTHALVAMTDRAFRYCPPAPFFEGWYADGSTYRDVFNPRDFLRREI